MKITDIKTIVVNAEMRNWVFIKVETDEGVVGWGEASLEWKTRGVIGCVEDLKPYLIGQDPTRIEHLWQMMYRQPFFRAGAVGLSALSGIDIALWDIKGKVLGKPVWDLIGGLVRESVRLYSHLGGGDMHSLYLKDSAQQMGEHAVQAVNAGYDAIKVLVVPRSAPLEGIRALKHAETCMAAIREAVGDAVDIMVDLHGRTTPNMAVLYAEALKPFRPFFLEEPCLPETVEALQTVARATTIPIASGERLVTRFQFRPLLESHACAIIQPDVCHAGGISEVKKIAAMAETYYVSVAPHNPLGPISTAACLHIGFSTPNFLIQEAIRQDVPWRDDVVDCALVIEKGRVRPTDRPGLGVSVNEKEAAKHPYQQEVLLRYFHEDGSVADW